RQVLLTPAPCPAQPAPATPSASRSPNTTTNSAGPPAGYLRRTSCTRFILGPSLSQYVDPPPIDPHTSASLSLRPSQTAAKEANDRSFGYSRSPSPPSPI